ncbi:MAG: hypothetical protein ABI460_21340 [Caldimonas sp.]
MHVITLMHEGFGRAVVSLLMRPRPQYWLARLYLCCSVLLTTAFAWVLPVSAQKVALDAIGPEAWWVLGGVTAIAVVGIVDSIVNDLMPERYHFRWADRRRYQVFMVLALLLWTLVWLCQHGPSVLLIARYALDGTACVLVAVFDTVARVKQVRRSMGSA